MPFPTPTFIEFQTSDKNPSYDIKRKYQITGGTPPYEWSFYNHDYVPVTDPDNFIYIDERRYFANFFWVRDATGLATQNLYESITYYTHPQTFESYDFLATGDLTIYPNYPYVQNIIPTINYSIYNDSGVKLDGPYTSPIFTGIPQQNVWLKVEDVYNASFNKLIEYQGVTGLNLIKDPDNLSFVNDPMVAIWDSSGKTIAGMKYEYTFYDSIDIELLTISQHPNINANLYGVADMSKVYNNYYTSPVYDITDIYPSEHIKRYTYKVTDTLSAGSNTSATKYYIKAATAYGEDINLIDYTGEINNDHKFLKYWNGPVTNRHDEYATELLLNGTFDGNDVINNVNCIFMVKSTKEFINYGVNDAIYTTDNTILIDSTIDTNNYQNTALYIPSGILNYKDAIDNGSVYYADGTVVSGTTDYFDDLEYYQIAMGYWDGTNITRQTEFAQYEVDTNPCNKWDPVHFLYLDRYCNYRTYTFKGDSEIKHKIKRRSISNDYYGYSNSDWSYNIGDRGERTNYVDEMVEYVANTGFIDDITNKNLLELYRSSDVYVVKDGDIYPVIITNTNIREQRIKNDRLFNLTVTYNLAVKINNNY